MPIIDCFVLHSATRPTPNLTEAERRHGHLIRGCVLDGGVRVYANSRAPDFDSVGNNNPVANVLRITDDVRTLQQARRFWKRRLLAAHEVGQGAFDENTGERTGDDSGDYWERGQVLMPRRRRFDIPNFSTPDRRKFLNLPGGPTGDGKLSIADSRAISYLIDIPLSIEYAFDTDGSVGSGTTQPSALQRDREDFPGVRLTP